MQMENLKYFKVQRDAGMLSLINPARVDFEPAETTLYVGTPHKHRSLVATPLREGELVLLKDENNAIDWYCPQILQVLPTHIIVHYYTTEPPPLENYSHASYHDRKIKISLATLFKTWCLNMERGPITIMPPDRRKGHEKYLYSNCHIVWNAPNQRVEKNNY